MKKILSVLTLAMMLVMPMNVFAENNTKTYEVPVEIMHISKEANKKSMANNAIKHTAIVEENSGKATYTIMLKPLKFMNLDGQVTNLFALSGDTKVEAVKETESGEYNAKFSFTRDSVKEHEITIAMWVDAMDQMSGGVPGSGEQKAILKLDWDKANEISVNPNANKNVNTNSNEIKINVNGKEIKLDTPAYIENNRTMVPVRFISEALGLKVNWISEEQIVEVVDKESIKLKIGESFIKKADGSTIKIDSPAVIKNSRTFVPLRAIAEISGAKVSWNDNTRTVEINK